MATGSSTRVVESGPGQVLLMTERIEQSAAEIEELLARRGSAVRPAPDFDQLRRVCRGLEDNVLELSHSVDAHHGVQDYEVRKLLEYLIRLRRAVEDDGADPDAVALEVMRLQDVLRRLERSVLHARLEAAGEAIGYIFDVLDGVSTADLAHLLGVSDKTVNGWRGGTTPSSRAPRVVLTAQLLSYLGRSLTTRGLLMWFDTEFDALGGLAPSRMIATDIKQAEARLVPFARGGRAQLGS